MVQLSPNADSSSLWQLAGHFSRDGELPQDINAQIATMFGVIEQPFTTSLAAAYDLLDELSVGEDYVNVDYREYRDEGYVICDINHDYGSWFEGSCRHAANRNLALVGATLAAARRFDAEVEEDDNA